MSADPDHATQMMTAAQKVRQIIKASHLSWNFKATSLMHKSLTNAAVSTNSERDAGMLRTRMELDLDVLFLSKTG